MRPSSFCQRIINGFNGIINFIKTEPVFTEILSVFRKSKPGYINDQGNTKSQEGKRNDGKPADKAISKISPRSDMQKRSFRQAYLVNKPANRLSSAFPDKTGKPVS